MTLNPSQIAQIEYEVAKYPDYVQKFYRACVAKGQSPRFALMCAVRQAPGTKHTDRTFNAERRQIMDNMQPKQQAAYLKMARQAGINTHGKFYVGGLGRPTDPAAWCSTVDDAKDVCKKRNLTAAGLFEHKGHEVPPPPKQRMAPDIKRRLVASELARDPKLAAKCAGDPAALRRIEGQVVDRHAPPCT